MKDWLYRPTDLGLFAVGYYASDGSWQPEPHEHADVTTARARVCWLNRDQAETSAQPNAEAATSMELRIDAAARAVRLRKASARRTFEKRAAGPRASRPGLVARGRAPVGLSRGGQ